jgi:hypothetical protein
MAEQNVTTLFDKEEATDVLDNDLLYLLRGVSSEDESRKDLKLKVRTLIDHISSVQANIASVTVTAEDWDFSAYKVNVMVTLGANLRRCTFRNVSGIHIGLVKHLDQLPCTVTIGQNVYEIPGKGALIFVSKGYGTVVGDVTEGTFDKVTVVGQNATTLVTNSKIKISSGDSNSAEMTPESFKVSNQSASTEIVPGKIKGVDEILPKNDEGLKIGKKIVVTNGHQGATINPDGSSDFTSVDADSIDAGRIHSDEIEANSVNIDNEEEGTSAIFNSSGMLTTSRSGRKSSYGNNTTVAGSVTANSFIRSDSFMEALAFRISRIYTSNDCNDTADVVLGQAPASYHEIRIVHNNSNSNNVYMGIYAGHCGFFISVNGSWKRLD